MIIKCNINLKVSFLLQKKIVFDCFQLRNKWQHPTEIYIIPSLSYIHFLFFPSLKTTITVDITPCYSNNIIIIVLFVFLRPTGWFYSLLTNGTKRKEKYQRIWRTPAIIDWMLARFAGQNFDDDTAVWLIFYAWRTIYICLSSP